MLMYQEYCQGSSYLLKQIATESNIVAVSSPLFLGDQRFTLSGLKNTYGYRLGNRFLLASTVG